MPRKNPADFQDKMKGTIILNAKQYYTFKENKQSTYFCFLICYKWSIFLINTLAWNFKVIGFTCFNCWKMRAALFMVDLIVDKNDILYLWVPYVLIR